MKRDEMKKKEKKMNKKKRILSAGQRERQRETERGVRHRRAAGRDHKLRMSFGPVIVPFSSPGDNSIRCWMLSVYCYLYLFIY